MLSASTSVAVRVDCGERVFEVTFHVHMPREGLILVDQVDEDPPAEEKEDDMFVSELGKEL